MERNDLLADVMRYSRAVKLSPSTVCLRAVGNPHLPKRLEAGGQCLPRTADRVRAFMVANPPKEDGSEQEQAA